MITEFEDLLHCSQQPHTALYPEPAEPILKISCSPHLSVDRNSSVGIATRYVLGGPGIESRWVRDFPNMYKLALVPTQPPIRWVPGPFLGTVKRPGRGVNDPSHLEPRLKKE
jgi:hypothetical protein